MIAKALVANNAKAVYILGRRKDKLEDAAAQCANGNIVPLVCDVTSKDSLTEAADRVQKDHGYLNALIANSGIIGPSMRMLPKDRKPSVKEFKDVMWEAPMEDFTNAAHLNCTAVFYTALAFLELLEAGNQKKNVKQKSQIVVTASIAGISRVPAAGFAYSTSKAAALHLVKMLATYFAPYKIRCNSIAPGPYPSEMNPRVEGEIDATEEGGLPAERVPLERMGSEEDMAGAALFMLSGAGAYINGNTLVTDGGRTGILPGTY